MAPQSPDRDRLMERMPMMTRAEALAYNKGVEAVLAIARRSAAAIAGTSRRRVHEDFAVAALGELAEAARGLLIEVPAPDVRPER